MATFIQTVTRIASDLRRSNLTQSIKDAINEAIEEAARTRFWFNEVEMGDTLNFGSDYTFTDPFPLTEVDYVHLLEGSGQRTNIPLINEYDHFLELTGNAQSGRPQFASFYKGRLRIWPTADATYSLLIGGVSKRLTPTPFTTDNQTNAWLNEGLLYIRALAKRNVLRDVIRDFGEAKVWESVAEDYKQQLIDETNMKMGDSRLRSTAF